MKLVKRFILYFIVPSACLITSSAIAGNVSSLSRPVMLQDGAGNSYQRIDVNCSHISEPRGIQTQSNNRRWCSDVVQDVCGKNKLSAAKKVCSAKFDRVLRSANPERPATGIEQKVDGSAPQADVVEVVAQPEKIIETQADTKESLSLEERRIKLEQQKIELRRQELELEKQQLELERAEPK